MNLFLHLILGLLSLGAHSTIVQLWSSSKNPKLGVGMSPDLLVLSFE